MKGHHPFKPDRQVIHDAKGPIFIRPSGSEEWLRTSKKEVIEQLIKKGYRLEGDQRDEGFYLSIVTPVGGQY